MSMIFIKNMEHIQYIITQKKEIIYYNHPKLYETQKNRYEKNFEKSAIRFQNIGNSCYINQFLQILLHTPNFLRILNEYMDFKYDNDVYLIYNLRQISEYPYNSDYKNIKKIMGKINPKYETYTPGDSQNFAIDLIDKYIKQEKICNENI